MTSSQALAQKIWDYHLLHQALQPVDILMVLGSNDIRVADTAAKLFLEKYAPLIVCSGNIGELTRGKWNKPEAEIFAEQIQSHGIPQEKIIIEKESTNTGENILFTKKLLQERNISCQSILIVQKPFMERRAYATAKQYWPEVVITVTSPEIPLNEYPTKEIPEDDLIATMVGDLQRLKIYSEKGFQIPQDIPPDVWAAYEELVKRGYTQHLIP